MAGRLRLPSRPRDEARMTLIEHLDELRSRIIKVGVAFVLAATVAWFFREQVFDLLLEPAGNRLEGKLYVTSVAEQFINDLKLALYVAFVATIPIFLYQAWAFVAPAVGEMGRAFTYILITLACRFLSRGSPSDTSSYCLSVCSSSSAGHRTGTRRSSRRRTTWPSSRASSWPAGSCSSSRRRPTSGRSSS